MNRLIFTPKSFTRLVVGIAALSLLGACSTVQKRVDFTPGANDGSKKQQFADSLQTMPGDSETDGLDPIAKAAFWGTRYDREQTNPAVVVKFSQSLRAIGSNGESLRIMTQASKRITPTADMNLELGRALIANDRAFEAVRPIEKAIEGGKSDDWRAYSAYGVALDKIGEHKQAQQQYRTALDLNGKSASILNNLGLSYALSGDLYNAESTLRQAVSLPEGTSRTRQNLALVLSLAGKTKEAERLARSDLPPRVADNNADYFRSLMTQPAYWQGLSADNADLPDFDAPSFAPASPVEQTPVTPLPDYKAPAPKPAVPQTLSENEDAKSGAQGALGITPPVATGAPVQLETTSMRKMPPQGESQDQKKQEKPKLRDGKLGS